MSKHPYVLINGLIFAAMLVFYTTIGDIHIIPAVVLPVLYVLGISTAINSGRTAVYRERVVDR